MLGHLWSEYGWIGKFIFPICIFGVWIMYMLHVHVLMSFAENSYYKPCKLFRSIKSVFSIKYLMIIKDIYKQSNPSIPALCLVLQLGCGLCRVFEQQRIFRIYLGLKPFICFFKPETVEVVLSSSTIIDKSREYEFLEPWLGTGLLTSTGTKWRYRRKLLTPSFHFTILEDFVSVFHEQSNVLASKLEDLAEKPWVDVVPLMANCTLDIICQTAMGVRISAQGGGHTDYVKAVYEVGDIFLYRVLRPWLYSDIIFKFTPTGRKFYKNMHCIHSFTRKVIKEKKECMIKFGKLSPGEELVPNGSPMQRKKRRAFLETLLEHHLKDPSFTEEDIREEVDTFMFEGHDTTAMALSWTVYCLGLHEQIQREVHDELDDIFQNDVDREITREDLTRMKYLECVIKETLRLFPSVPFIGREVKKSFEVLGHTIEPGSLCFIFPLMLHQDAASFPKPEKFDPERFFPENSVGRHPYAYVPFSAGPRNCIGQKFALMEEKTVLANVFRRFRAVSLDSRDKINVIPNLIFRNVQPLRVRFILRK